MIDVRFEGTNLAEFLPALPADLRIAVRGRDSDILVLGASALDATALLSTLRYRRGKRTPIAVISSTLPNLKSLVNSMKVPYITYGLAEGHLRIQPLAGGKCRIHTPVGECTIVSGICDPLDCLALIGVGLALRISLEELVPALERVIAGRLPAAQAA